jgi:hypothetical protein
MRHAGGKEHDPEVVNNATELRLLLMERLRKHSAEHGC